MLPKLDNAMTRKSLFVLGKNPSPACCSLLAFLSVLSFCFGAILCSLLLLCCCLGKTGSLRRGAELTAMWEASYKSCKLLLCQLIVLWMPLKDKEVDYSFCLFQIWRSSDEGRTHEGAGFYHITQWRQSEESFTGRSWLRLAWKTYGHCILDYLPVRVV